jgi:capsular polysaccharide biosynthesis protein
VPILYAFEALYAKYGNKIRLLIPESSYSILLQNIVKLYGIDEAYIVILPINTRCKMNTLVKINVLDTSWNFAINKILIKTFVNLRNKLSITQEASPSRYIYLCRSSVISAELNTCAAGKNRTIINQKDLNDLLKKYNFEFIDVATNILEEKRDKLINAKIIITETGANILNILFTSFPSHLILLTNSYTAVDWAMYWEQLLRSITNFSFTCSTFRSISENIDVNDPYLVDIPQIEKDILKYI